MLRWPVYGSKSLSTLVYLYYNRKHSRFWKHSSLLQPPNTHRWYKSSKLVIAATTRCVSLFTLEIVLSLLTFSPPTSRRSFPPPSYMINHTVGHEWVNMLNGLPKTTCMNGQTLLNTWSTLSPGGQHYAHSQAYSSLIPKLLSSLGKAHFSCACAIWEWDWGYSTLASMHTW